ncbi:DUF1367 family protein [Gracilimonas sediminicola]|uniref:DUF1367 family protein n=1 Tax=Gracilimonas sediminicola TaxID=2952158 RepID=A0A9X2RE71_9BACT|nr:DUF1367 family protein [Gracilimonas sediminicola]MCP9290038.1 DUF1367 family protein [Gracilimonas sediminicola]
MKLWVSKQSGKLFPVDVEAQVRMNKLPAGEPIMIKYSKVRNPRHHRKYFAFFNKVYENLPEHLESNWPDVNSFRKAMEMYSGFFTETINLKGERFLMPKSIAYEKLDEMAFSELHNKVKTTIGTRI